MITSFFITIAYFLLNGIFSIFPSSSGFPTDVDTAVSAIGGYLGILDPLVPISTMLTIITLIITFELAVFAFKGIKWIFSHIPLIGGKG